MWHLHPVSMSSLCFVLASLELWEEREKKSKGYPLTYRNKSLEADFIIINTSQLPSPHIAHSHCCYFFKWVEGGQKKSQTTCVGQRQMSFCVLTWVMFTVVKSLFGVSGF